MPKRTVKSVLASIARAVGSLFIPQTPRGRLRQAVVFVSLLLVLAGNLSHPEYWDKTADWANTKLEQAKAPGNVRIPHFWRVPYRLGLDLQGGTHLVYVADIKNIPSEDQADAMSGVRDVIERRVNAFGVSEPLVQTNKSGEQWRVIVDLAGVKDVGEAIKLIGETPILEFKEENVDPPRQLTAAEQKDMDAYNAGQLAKAKEALKKAKLKGADFAALAKEYGEDAAAKDAGGDLGFLKPNGPHAVLVEKVLGKKLKPGMLFPDVITDADGHHAVKYEEQREAGKEVLASHILICWSGLDRCEKTRTKEEARALADKIRNEATTANFSAKSKESSDDTGSGAQGGDLGWFGPGAMVAPFEKAAFDLQKGAISEVVETDFGFHIIYKRDERPTYEYRLRHIQRDTKSAADYLPAPDQWKNTQLSGKHLKRALLQFGQNNEPQISIEFNEEGKALFAEITKRNVGKPVAIYLDNQPISIPTVQEEIREGSAVISGSFTIPEAKLLVRRLNAGALPVPITLESQQSVGASLGQESLQSSLKAGMIGFLIVALFMLLYYRLAGIIAVLALLLYAGLNLSLYKLIPVTLSLSGIAGFILSVGMAVDANILIFERTKDELLRGRPLGSAIDEGFKRAWTSIRDSNFCTLISCTVLYFTSSSLIKGFALTLALGVLVSMFSAITVSRTLLRLVAGWKFLKHEFLYLSGTHFRVPAAKEQTKK
jgi:protein-export membrane protein SecD